MCISSNLILILHSHIDNFKFPSYFCNLFMSEVKEKILESKTLGNNSYPAKNLSLDLQILSYNFPNSGKSSLWMNRSLLSFESPCKIKINIHKYNEFSGMNI